MKTDYVHVRTNTYFCFAFIFLLQHQLRIGQVDRECMWAVVFGSLHRFSNTLDSGLQPGHLRTFSFWRHSSVHLAKHAKPLQLENRSSQSNQPEVTPKESPLSHFLWFLLQATGTKNTSTIVAWGGSLASRFTGGVGFQVQSDAVFCITSSLQNLLL